MAYLTIAEFEEDTGATVTDAAEVQRAIDRASRDVDSLLTGWGPPDQDGLRIDPTDDLEPHERAGLRAAVVAQTEYRIEMGPAFFRTNEPDSLSGPDFSQTGRRGRIADGVFSELTRVGILQTGGRLRPRGTSVLRPTRGPIIQ